MPFIEWNGADPVQNQRALRIIEGLKGKDSPAAISLSKDIARQRRKYMLKAWAPLLIALALCLLFVLGVWAFPHICAAFFSGMGK
jgi:hypothetical protein